jgi:hypothetical protein
VDLLDGRYSISLAANKNASVPLLVNAPAKQFDASVTTTQPTSWVSNSLDLLGHTNGARSGLNVWYSARNVVRRTSAEFFRLHFRYSGPTNHCSSAEFDVANQLMNADCGDLSAAWVKIDA